MKNTIAAIMILLSVLIPAGAFCEDDANTRIDNVIVYKKPALKVSFLVKDAFTKDIEEAIKSGLPTSFTFIIELERVKSMWFDEAFGRWEFKHTVKYDNLKEEYEISIGETNEKGIRTKDFAEMKKLMTTFSSVVLDPAAPMSRGDEYEFRIMAELHTVELPFFLDYMLFFVKIWDFKTDWYSHRFTL